MFKTYWISRSIQMTYRINSILYSLKQTPILRSILPAQPYRVRGLKLFRIRIREISKINALPALLIGLGLDGVLLTSGGGAWVEYLLIPVTMLGLSLFFSIHYLTLYYLLQPFNAGTEVKSGTYQFFTGATYFVCYLMMQIRGPAVLFGLLCIGFCAAYSAIASVLVYRFAPRTFRIRQ